MAFAALSPGQPLSDMSDMKMDQISDSPFILTHKVKDLWKLLVSAMKDGQQPEPVLLYGPPGDILIVLKGDLAPNVSILPGFERLL